MAELPEPDPEPPLVPTEKSSPVPDSATVCGLPSALSAMVTDAVREPPAVGLNVTLMVQLAFTARVAAHVLVSPKSPALVPVTLIELIVMVALPVFVSVTDCAALVEPTSWLPKLRLTVEREAVGPVIVRFPAT